MRHAAREMRHVEVRDAGTNVPARGLGVDPLERPRELLLHSKRHREGQELIEQLRVADDDALEVLRLDATQEFLEPEHLLEGARSRLSARWHDLGEDDED